MKAAEILVACGYGYAPLLLREDNHWRIIKYGETTDFSVQIDHYADTLEGRRQADAIEDWLFSKTKHFANYGGVQLWEMSKTKVTGKAYHNRHQWRLDRIKWCLEQLEER